MAVNTDYKACNVVADRNKVGAENLKAMEKQKKKGKFTDPAFPRDINAIYWPSVEETGEGNLLPVEKLQQVEWKRLSDEYPEATLFGKDHIRP